MNCGSHTAVLAAAAKSRAGVYALLVRIFAHLPGPDLVAELGDPSFDAFLDACCGVGNFRLREGASRAKSYCAHHIVAHPSAAVIESLSVDRTALLRGAWGGSLKPPHESLYTKAQDELTTIRAVRASYRAAGLLPEDDIGESVDYLGVELDFMYRLCMREIETYGEGGDFRATVIDEDSFLADHLGRWVGDFCREAEKSARTELYAGFIMILDGFVQAEKEYLKDLRRLTA